METTSGIPVEVISYDMWHSCSWTLGFFYIFCFAILLQLLIFAILNSIFIFFKLKYGRKN